MPNAEQRQLIFDTVGYQPTDDQWAVHNCNARERLVAGGERGGKSMSSEKDLLSRLFEGHLFWLVAADYERTRAEFNYLCEDLVKIVGEKGFTSTKSVDPGEILIPELGIRIATKSAKDPRKLAMEAPDGILVCEASQIDYETYLRLRGRTAEKRGWMLMSGTFESSLGWYVDLFNLGQSPNEEEIVSFSLPTWGNTRIFPGGRTDPEILRQEALMTKEWFMERFGGVPSPPKGRVFNEFRNNIHTGMGGEYDFDPGQEVRLWIDPGYSDAYAVEVIQRRGEEIYIVDEIYERGLVTSDIIKIAKHRPWWNMVIGGTIDIAGYQHQAMAAPAELWVSEGGVPLNAKKLRIQDGIEQTKRHLIVNPITNRPLLHINTKCKGAISEMGGCPNPITGQTSIYRWKEDRDGNVIGDKPDDKHNHACKAIAYGLVDLVGFTKTSRKAKVTWI